MSILTWLRHNGMVRQTLWWLLWPVRRDSIVVQKCAVPTGGSEEFFRVERWIVRQSAGRTADGVTRNRRRWRSSTTVSPIFSRHFASPNSIRILRSFPRRRSTPRASSGAWKASAIRRSLAEYAAKFPDFADRVIRYHPGRIVRARLAYVVFVHNVAFFLDTIERNRLPFVYTLYPGGGFQLDYPTGDARLPVHGVTVVSQSHRHATDHARLLVGA